MKSLPALNLVGHGSQPVTCPALVMSIRLTVREWKPMPLESSSKDDIHIIPEVVNGDDKHAGSVVGSDSGRRARKTVRFNLADDGGDDEDRQTKRFIRP